MLLTVDVGNTNIKSALCDDDQIEGYKVHGNIENVIDYISLTNFDVVAICSVNPVSEKILLSKLQDLNLPVFQSNVNQRFNFTISYQTPDTLGMDRVCSAAGALENATKEKIISKNQYLITIDFGTATTINIVSPDRKFIGGLIAPGIKTMLKSLNQNTALLPLIDTNSYEGMIGKSTESSIISGVITSTIGMVNETAEKLKNDSNNDPVIFVTGGNSKLILPYFRYKAYYEEALVLKGLKIVYDLNK